MDRRTTLKTLIPSLSSPAKATVINSGLEPYTGSWDLEQASHLLRRTTFGPTKVMLESALALGLDGCMESLFAEIPLPAPPLIYDFEDDPNVEIGESWIDAPHFNAIMGFTGARRRSLSAWTLKNIHAEGISIREKLTLFWHNHFAVNRNGLNDPRFFYRYITSIRSQAWGNFRQLAKDITIDPTMLRFLNGRQNTAGSPNENYARELLELFTIGKGPLAGPGDYTNYTETDVIQMARVLTGWRDRGHNSSDPEIPVGAYFTPSRHDDGEKQLSERFDNIVIPDMGDQEYAYLIDIIFQKDEVARFISRKLYRWFIYYNITEQAENDVIEPMAQLLIDNDYEIKPALQALLSSAHFFDMLNLGPMIRNPLDYAFTLIKTTEIPFPEGELYDEYNVWWRLFVRLRDMEMEYYFLPDVAGWKAYYQEPLYYRSWINATSLQLRSEMTNTLTGNGYNFGGVRIKVEPLEWIEQLDNPNDPNDLINELARLLLPQPLLQNQLDALKEVLIPGLPDYEWTLEYNLYLANPDDENLREAVDNKLREMLSAMVNLAEFHLS